MPFLVIISPNIPADKQAELEAAWPQIKEDISKQPGVIGVAGGQVVNESGTPVTEPKFVHTITFESAADDKAFTESAWYKEREEQYKDAPGGEPRVKKFETDAIPNEKPKTFTQFCFLDIADESKHAEARQSWLDLVAALGQAVHFGGKSVGGGQSTGLGILGWNSEDEAKAAYTKPEAQAALQKYQSFGKSVAVMVKLEV
ncbi:hypothetical protein CORC01_00777 [Colletotrichum orchidophilum]|uniref:ABM domain-containing protein n=1 Tax=Colletotrichum orchidophilum TaxID=1209926 RepID=A0A1G4BRJ3_9PEZI|nr:uncharacterized protein CORC01_00777 [Colletotrichum orchidophilum]OHF03915.1 hypothetical protein CORC01_00777 [Colletotrichum orchidophilum]